MVRAKPPISNACLEFKNKRYETHLFVHKKFTQTEKNTGFPEKTIARNKSFLVVPGLRKDDDFNVRIFVVYVNFISTRLLEKISNPTNLHDYSVFSCFFNVFFFLTGMNNT